MVAYTKLSPNHSGQRTHTIDRITPHCVVGQCTAEGLGDWFAKSSTQASSNYGIDRDGRVGLYVEEKNRSWCSSSNANDQRAITIECASDTAEPYAFRDVVYQTLIKLCVDICKRNGKKKLIWFGDKDKTLNYSPKSDEMILTVHRWFANKSCPGNWMYARMGDLANKVTAQLGTSSDTPVKTSGTQAKVLAGLSEGDVIKTVGALFTADMNKSGILASVSLAQFILESGYGKSELAQNANNVFGMKKSLSGNTWDGSSWDGKSVYTKKTQEDDGQTSASIRASRIPSPTTPHTSWVRRTAASSAMMVSRAARITRRPCRSSRTAATPPARPTFPSSAASSRDGTSRSTTRPRLLLRSNGTASVRAGRMPLPRREPIRYWPTPRSARMPIPVILFSMILERSSTQERRR